MSLVGAAPSNQPLAPRHQDQQAWPLLFPELLQPANTAFPLDQLLLSTPDAQRQRTAKHCAKQTSPQRDVAGLMVPSASLHGLRVISGGPEGRDGGPGALQCTLQLAFECLTPDSSSGLQLYDSPWTCRAVVRAIPPLAQAYLMRMLFLDESMPAGVQPRQATLNDAVWRTKQGSLHVDICMRCNAGVVDAWCQPGAKSQHAAAMQTLAKLQIMPRQKRCA